jgi:hypothetical protein
MKNTCITWKNAGIMNRVLCTQHSQCMRRHQLYHQHIHRRIYQRVKVKVVHNLIKIRSESLLDRILHNKCKSLKQGAEKNHGDYIHMIQGLNTQILSLRLSNQLVPPVHKQGGELCDSIKKILYLYYVIAGLHM